VENRYEVNTKFTREMIAQSVDLVTNDIRTTIYRRVINLMDTQTKDALIQMGWIPPKQETT